MAAAQAQNMMSQIPNYLLAFRDFQQERLSRLRPIQEFFDVQRISRPNDLNEATVRISHNTRYFSGNYLVVMTALAVYALLTNPLLLIALFFLVGGFAAINRFAPEPTQIGQHTVTQKSLYTGLFVIGIPMLWWAAPLSTLFWVVGSSAISILGHASLLEPSVESEYGATGSIDAV